MYNLSNERMKIFQGFCKIYKEALPDFQRETGGILFEIPG